MAGNPWDTTPQRAQDPRAGALANVFANAGAPATTPGTVRAFGSIPDAKSPHIRLVEYVGEAILFRVTGEKTVRTQYARPGETSDVDVPTVHIVILTGPDTGREEAETLVFSRTVGPQMIAATRNAGSTDGWCVARVVARGSKDYALTPATQGDFVAASQWLDSKGF